MALSLSPDAFTPGWFASEFARTGKTQAQLFHFLRERLGEGIDRTKVNKTVRGKRRVQPDELLLVLAFFDLMTQDRADPSDGRPGSGGPAPVSDDPPSNVRPPAEPPGLDIARLRGPRNVPVLGIAVGGSAGDFERNGETIAYAPRPPAIEHNRDVYVLYTSNDSMSPRYEPGDPLYVDPHKPPKPGDDVILEVHPSAEGEPTAGFVKRFVKRAGSQVVVKQFNPEKELTFEARRIKTFHRVIPYTELLST